jgi:hypothetical protein
MRALTEVLRTTGIGGKVMLTRSSAALPIHDQLAILAAVHRLTAFIPAKDPQGAHDGAVLTVLSDLAPKSRSGSEGSTPVGFPPV